MDPADGLVRGVPHDPGEQVRGMPLLLLGAGQVGDAGGQLAQHAVHGPAGDGAARLGVGGEGLEPGAQARDVLLREQTALVEAGLGDHVDPGVGEAALGEHAPQVRGDVLRRALGHAAEHDGHGDVAGGGLVQQLPGHGVGVAVRRRREDPQVGGFEELPGQRAVLVRHGVDVRGVHEGDA